MAKILTPSGRQNKSQFYNEQMGIARFLKSSLKEDSLEFKKAVIAEESYSGIFLQKLIANNLFKTSLVEVFSHSPNEFHAINETFIFIMHNRSYRDWRGDGHFG